MFRDGIFKPIRSPEIDSKEPIPPTFSQAGQYDNPIPTRFLAFIDCSKILALDPFMFKTILLYCIYLQFLMTCFITIIPTKGTNIFYRFKNAYFQPDLGIHTGSFWHPGFKSVSFLCQNIQKVGFLKMTLYSDNVKGPNSQICLHLDSL